MEQQTNTGELILALQDMLSKNSDRYSAKEVETLNEAIAGLETLQSLQEKREKEPSSKEVGKAIEVQLVKLIGSTFRFFLHPEVIKFIHDNFSS